MKLLKNKTFLIVIVVVVLLALGAGGYYFLSANSNTKNTENLPVDDNVVQKLSPSAIGLNLEASSDKKKVRFVIAKASSINSIEYELLYTANSTAEEQSEGAQKRVQRGITGQESISSGTSTYQSSWLILGSQSANVVRYDTGVKSVSITLKITETNGKVYQVQDSTNL